MGQIGFANAECAGKRGKARREVFLEEIERVVPWKTLVFLIEPHYPVAGRSGRPYPLESMLRVHLMQDCFALSDPVMAEAPYEIALLRVFVRVSLGESNALATAIQNFRHLLETIDLAEHSLEAVDKHLVLKGLPLTRDSSHGWSTSMGRGSTWVSSHSIAAGQFRVQTTADALTERLYTTLSGHSHAEQGCRKAVIRVTTATRRESTPWLSRLGAA